MRFFEKKERQPKLPLFFKNMCYGILEVVIQPQCEPSENIV